MRRAVGSVVLGLAARCVVPIAAGAIAVVHAQVAAQTLDLDGTRDGPAIPTMNAAVELSGVLETEARGLEEQAPRLTGEARAAAEAKARLRRMAVALLQSGAQRPWNDSAPVVFGVRIANMLSRADAVIDAAAGGTRLGGAPALTAVEARAAVEALGRLARADLSPVRAAIVQTDARATTRPDAIALAFAKILAPLAELAERIEGERLPDAWPVVAAAMAPSAASAPPSIEPARLKARIEALPAGDARDAATAIFVVATKETIPSGAVLRSLEGACDALAWTEERRRAPKPAPVDEAALDALEAEVTESLGQVAARGALDALVQLDALRPRLRAIRAMLAMRAESWINDAQRRALSDACAALCAARGPDAGLDGARAGVGDADRARIAERIAEACDAAKRLADDEVREAPRDVRDVLKNLDRDARIAIHALPAAFAEMTRDPSRAADPAALSALTRVTSLAADRARIAALQELIDRIGGADPKSGRAFSAVARRLARMLLDPIKRSEAQVAFSAVESQAAAALPFAFEDELMRGTPRATALTLDQARRVADSLAAVRVEWAKAIGAGNFGGPASVRLDLAGRYASALRDVAQLSAPITREQGDRLSTWGGWAARRALLAPAALDLDARAGLAARSLLAMGTSSDAAAFARDVETLERALPLVRLAARLERTLGPSLQADANTMASMLATIVQTPARDAALAREWSRLQTLDRALFEAEFARRTGSPDRRAELAAFMASLAEEIEVSAFGGRPKVGAVPGFDGGTPDQSGAPQRRPSDRPRSR